MRTIAALLSVTLLVACRHDSPPQPGAPLPAVPVRAISVGRGAATRWVAARLQSVARATISSRLSATIASIPVREGQHLTQGELLLRLDTRDLEQQLIAAERGEVTARAQYDRIEKLASEGVVGARDRDLAASALADAHAAVVGLRNQLGYAEIRAPFPGTVQSRLVDRGDLVTPGMPLIEFSGDSGLELIAALTRDEAAPLRIGSVLSFESEGRRSSVTVSALSTDADDWSHRQSLRATVAEGGAGFRAGAYARLALEAGAGGPIVIPRAALVERGELSGVFVIDNGRTALRWLSLGDESESQVEVRSGLAGGERLIADPSTVQDGQAVEIAP